VAPVHFCQFPAILKGWIDRVLTYGFAFTLTADGWRGDIAGRQPLLQHRRALIMTSTLFNEQAYDDGVRDAMTRLIDDWAFRYPGIQHVEHVYFYNASSAPPTVLEGYLRQARRLGREFDQAPPPPPPSAAAGALLPARHSLADFYLAADLLLAYTAEPFEYPGRTGRPRSGWSAQACGSPPPIHRNDWTTCTGH